MMDYSDTETRRPNSNLGWRLYIVSITLTILLVIHKMHFLEYAISIKFW